MTSRHTARFRSPALTTAGAGLFLAVALGSGSARAGDPAVAEALFDEGRKLVDAGKIEAGCEKLSASWKEEPSVGTMLNLASCHEKLGKTATAWREYLEAAKLAERNGEKDRAKLGRELADELEGKLARLTVNVPSVVDGMTVTTGGKPLRPAAFGIAVAVDPGALVLKASAPNMRTWTQELRIKAGSLHTVTIPPMTPGAGGETDAMPKPVPAETEPEPNPKPKPIDEPPPDEGWSSVAYAGIGIGAVGVVGIGAGIVLGVLAGNEKDAALPSCPDGACSSSGFDQIESATGLAHGSTASFAIGGAALGAGILMIILGSGSDSEEQASMPWMRPDCSLVGCSLQVGGSF